MQEVTVDNDLDSVRVLTEPQTYRVLGISDRTWDRLKAAGDVPPKTRLSEGRIGYRVCDIRAWLDRRRQTSETQGAGEAA
jgi:predicted DNA-binding transcriptional regulator AlpA